MAEVIIFALLLTLAIEPFIYGAFDNFRLKTYLWMFGTNAVLNTTMNIILVLMPNLLAYLIVLVVAEILVYVIEGVIFCLVTKAPPWVGIIVSSLANTCSLLLGLYFNFHLYIQNYKIAFYIISLVLGMIISAEITVMICLHIKKRVAY